MSEGNLQRYFKAQAAKHGVLWRKIRFEGRRGCPDALIAHGGRCILVELKNPNKKGALSKLQEREIQNFMDVGLDVRVIDDREGIDDVLREITGT